MFVGRYLLQQLEHMEDTHEDMIRAIVSLMMVAALRRMLDSQAGREKQYLE